MALFGKKKTKEDILKNPEVREKIKSDVQKAEAQDDGGQAFFSSVANSPEYVIRGQILQQNAKVIEVLIEIKESILLLDQHLRELKDVASSQKGDDNDDEGGF